MVGLKVVTKHNGGFATLKINKIYQIIIYIYIAADFRGWINSK